MLTAACWPRTVGIRNPVTVAPQRNSASSTNEVVNPVTFGSPWADVVGDEGRDDLAPERAAERPHHGVHAGGDAGLRGRHRLHDQVAERGEGQPDPDSEQRRADQHVVGMGVRDGQPGERQGGDRAADDHGDLGPVAPGDAAGEAAEQAHHQRGRQQVQARDDDRGAEAEAGALGQLRELREDR